MKNSILSFIVLIFLYSTQVFLAQNAHSQQPISIVALGDSLVAGYELPKEKAFPKQLEKALQAKGYKVTVQNAGVSGDTAAAGLARLDWAVPKNTDAVIVELGANDALRGIDPKQTFQTLDTLLQKLKAKNVEILLAGMHTPQSYGPEYANAFAQMYPDLAKKHNVLLYPYFLDGIALKPEYNLPDGLHPNAKGVEIVVERILPTVEMLLKKVQQNK